MSSRNDSVCTAFLIWLDQHNDESPNPEQFTEDPASVVGGQQVDDRELRRAVDTLYAHNLIDGVYSYGGRPMLARICLTPAGTLVVNEHDGDLSAWRNATGPASMSVTAGGHVQAAVNSTNVTQTIHAVESGTGPVDRVRYERAASTLLAELDNLDLPDDQTAELRQAAEKIAAEIAQPEPDEGKLRRWGGVIVKGLGAVITSALGGTAARYIVELLGLASHPDRRR